MDEETVARIESELARIDAAIAELEAERERALCWDSEYADYVVQYRAYYTDDPLPIRRFYELSEELYRINRAMKDSLEREEYQAIWQKHKERLQYLERVLAA